MNFDFSFDRRVAQKYEAQRKHPAAVSQAIGAAIIAAAGQGARILEVGMGTGRIAWPAAEAGGRVFGFDISADMLRELPQSAQSGVVPPQRVQADMHHLPYEDGVFDAALAVHVLHLARDWRQVLTEMARSLRPEGAFIQGDDWIDPLSVVGRLRDELRLRAMARFPNTKPPSAGIDKVGFLRTLGGETVEEIIAAEWTTYRSANDRLNQIAQRMDAESWFLPEEIFEMLLQELRGFAAETWPDLDEPQPVTRRFILKVMRGHWR